MRPKRTNPTHPLKKQGARRGKNKNIHLGLSDKPSRFVVDLKEKAKLLSVQKNNKFNLNKNKIKEFCYNLAEQDFQDKMKKSAKAFFSQLNITPALCPARPLAKELIRQLPPRPQKNRLINQLAFVLLFKLLFSLGQKISLVIYKICYWLGWLVVWLVRFFYFIGAGLTKIIFKPIKFLIIAIGQLSFSLITALGKFVYYIWLKIVFALRQIKGLLELLPQKFSVAREKVSAKNFWILNQVQDDSSGNKSDAIKQPLILRLSFWSKFIPRPNLSYLKPVIVFALALLVLILPFKAYTYYKSLDNLKGEVLGKSEAALGELLSAGQSAAGMDFGQASQNFLQAGDNFLLAQNKLAEINDLLFALISLAPNNDLKLAAISKNILRIGELSAQLGQNLSLALDSLTSSKPGSQTGPNKSFTEIIDNFSLYGRQAAVNALAIKNEVNLINISDLPQAYREQFVMLKDKVNFLTNNLVEVVNLVEQMKSFLGATQDKRYLLVFQNNTELRASGGFIGSFALVDFRDGQLKNIETPGGGSYDTTAGLLAKIAAPEPLHLIAPLWHFWDANWWPDWPASAKKLMWFYEKSDGPTVDGVISFTPTVIEKLLAVIGPIDMIREYGLIFTADNFWLKTQELAERKADVTNEPKKIIGDLMNQLISELPARITKDNLLPLLKILEESLSGKHIMFYFTDTDLQNKIVELGWDGGLKQTAKDYLAVINTNIAGGKSDRKISQTVSHQAEIMPNGEIIDTVKISRTHKAIKREPFCGVRNVDWLRIYVPLGSELIDAQGFCPVDKIFFKPADPAWQNDPDVYAAEGSAQIHQASGTKIYQELGKTVFANWSQVDPGESTTITLKYKLPFKINNLKQQSNLALADKIIDQATALLNPGQKELYPYSLLVQKQPGAPASQIFTNLIANNRQVVWKYPKAITASETGWQINDSLNSDKFWAVLLEENLNH